MSFININESWVLDTVRFISTFHRARGSNEYNTLLHSLREMILELGVTEKNIEILEYPTGGEKYGNFETTMVWNVEAAELWLENPRQFITSFKECKTSVLFGSNPTFGWKVFELVDENFQGSFLDKAVLVNDNPSKAFKKYVKDLGAKALLIYYMRNQDETIGRTPERMPETVNYLSIPHTAELAKYGGYGFSLSWRQYCFLKKFVNMGHKVRLFINAELKTGNLQVLRIKIEGQSNFKIGIVAHLCHPSPGANDNASGCALALHLAEQLSKAPPNAKVDVILTPEFYGTIPYALENWYDLVINLDMVGEDQEKTGSTLLLHENLPFLPTYYDELLYQSLLKFAPRTSGSISKRFFRTRFAGGSDHLVFANNCSASPFIGQWPDKYYHTSDDTWDKCDPEMFKWIGNSVLETIRLANNLPDEVAEISKTKAKILARSFDNLPGEEIIKSAIEVAHGMKNSMPKPRLALSCVNYGPLGYDWVERIDESFDRRQLLEIGEVLYLSVRYMKDFDASVSFTSQYLGADAKLVTDILEFLIKEGYVAKVNQ